jgi:hypothetical protein
MKKKYYFVILFLIFAMFLVGCGGIITPDIDEIGGDAYLCENLLRGFYTALSNENFTQALSYCKPGGPNFEYVNNVWDIAQEYPTFYTTYQVYDVFDFKYVGNYLSLNYDSSYTIHNAYIAPQTTYDYNRPMLFEKVNGEWKMV